MSTATQDTAHAKDAEHHGVGHVVPFKYLLAVFLGLTFLTVVTVVASLFDFGEFNLLVAMAIAVVKATLVVLVHPGAAKFAKLILDRVLEAAV